MTPAKIETLRSDLASEVQTSDPQIVIISPDHFGAYTSNNLVYDPTVTTLCIQGYCLKAGGAFVAPHSPRTSTLLLQDHGIGAHLRYLRQYLPDARVIPLLVQARQDSALDLLSKQLRQLSASKETIIIGSVDRSHYVPEPWATLHDTTSRSILKDSESSRNDYRSLDVDCPSCLSLVNTLARADGLRSTLLRRDSSAEIFATTGFDNTSRVAVSYDLTGSHRGIGGLMTGVTMLWVGDTIYDRGIQKQFPDSDSLSRYLSERYESGDSSASPLTNFHRLGASIDLLGLNLETPLFASGTNCYPSQKDFSFCSSESLFDVLQPLGFNVVNLANNHRFDAGRAQYEQTKHILADRGMEVIDDTSPVLLSIRGIDLALVGYDFTDNQWSETLESSCTTIHHQTSHQRRVIVSVHRGQEYQSLHNTQQEQIARRLVQCGADAIIGHHPHVVQDIARIDGVPVVYSLGNFLMDQTFSDETRQGLMVGLVVPSSGTIAIFRGSSVAGAEK